MASIRQINGRWQVQIRRAGVRRSRTFNSRAEAGAWAHSIEAPLRFTARGPAPAGLAEAPATFGAVVRRYQEQELPKHRSGPNETHMLNHIHRHWIAAVPCMQLTSAHLAAYRDERLEQVKPGTVRRAFNLLRPMLDIARDEWGVAIDGNPARKVTVTCVRHPYTLPRAKASVSQLPAELLVRLIVAGDRVGAHATKLDSTVTSGSGGAVSLKRLALGVS